MANKFRIEFQSAAHNGNDACVGFRWVEVETFEYEADAIACRDELDEDYESTETMEDVRGIVI